MFKEKTVGRMGDNNKEGRVAPVQRKRADEIRRRREDTSGKCRIHREESLAAESMGRRGTWFHRTLNGLFRPVFVGSAFGVLISESAHKVVNVFLLSLNINGLF